MANNFAALFLIGILVLGIGAALPSETTTSSETCSDGFWAGGEYVEGTCVEGQVTTPNPTRGWAMGLGGLLLIVGTVGSVGSALTSNGEPINSEEAYTGVDLKVSADVINAETGEEFHKCFNVQARNTADAKEHFESEAVRHGYIVDGEVSVDLPATNNSGQNVSSEQRQSSIKAFQFESTRVFAALDSLPQNYWRNGIIIGTSLWGALLVGPVFSLIGGTLGAVLAYVYAVFYIGIPASVYMDSYHVQQDTEWNPSKHIYAGLAVIPWLNVVVGMFYLFRRRYAIQNREFSIPTIREDISTVSQRFKSKLQD